MKRRLLLLSFLLSTITSAQNSLNQILDSYENYFELPRETLFVHTNKTVYLPGETIWFTAYLYDRKENVSKSTSTNLICALFDESGEKVEDLLLNVENGIASGHVQLPKTISGEQIFLKAQTRWMKNFKEDDSFTTRLKLVSPLTTPHSELSADQRLNGQQIAIMPEGGHLVAHTVNTVGLKLLDGPKMNTSMSLRLFSENGTVLVNSIQVNEDGIGKFEFIPLLGQTYFLEGQPKNGSKILAKLEKAKPYGINLSVNNLFDDKVAILMKTNDQTLKEIKGKDHFLAIHRDGLLTLNAFQFEDTEHSIMISKDKLLRGVNIITVFDANLNPIIERLIFNEANLNTVRAKVSKIDTELKRDSIGLKINLYSKTQTNARLSVSVLPEDTESTEAEQSILSALLVQPYVKGPLKNMRYYLKNIDRIKKYELDNLLLTLGWSRYDWSNIFDAPPSEKYKLEDGFQITGKVLNANPEKDKYLTLYQKSHPQVYQTDIQDDKSFKLDNVTLHHGEKVYAALLNRRNKTEEPEITMKIIPSYKNKNISLSESFLIAKNKSVLGEEEEPLPVLTQEDYLVDDRLIALEGVTVSEDKIEKKLTHRPIGIIDAIFDGLKITTEEVKKRPTLQLVLQNLGYRTIITPLGNSIILPKNGTPSVVKPPVIVVDDVVMYNPSRGINNLPPNLLNSNTAGIDEIHYTHHPIEMGNRAVIYIYRKYGRYVGDKPKERFTSFLATEGFQRPKQFFNPQYANFSSPKFKSYGTLHWEGQLITDEQGEAEIMVPTLSQKGAKVFIEGIADDGTLISDYQTVSFE
ncbi:hypothetical protein [Flagellimonas allohymeniacidonis]|uniref:Macroglobulin domain-containing protein n=1 Tax=Flagellimonas allohymeniacidonis TaxID=2517819 RepID=A0A4Q8QFS3_9FLAO|nr:hypothetical protein [Allomuricauda hymeniacidonis]TAI48058.1 hypothetical protein EW142_15530 [Allomuricauda hymeniacidonis]